MDLRPIAAEEQPQIYAALLRVGRRLRLAERASIGLLPADRSVAIPPLAVQLAHALVALGCSPVNVFDANARLPGLATSLPDGDADGPFHTVWIAEHVTVTTASGSQRARVDPKVVRAHVDATASSHALVLVDLTGFELFGEHLTSLDYVGGVLLVATAGVTTEEDVMMRASGIDQNANLGVLLLG